MELQQAESVNAAFSSQSPTFDEYEENNGILKWMRSQIHQEVSKYICSGCSVLELNSGTGIDATFFASQGCFVTATDISEGMVKQCSEKVQRMHLESQIKVVQCSYTALDKIEGQYDFIFSDFGGLNCIPDLNEVTRQFSRLLKPGGYVTFVLMPPVCPWEMALALKGNFKIAFRRFNKDGAISHLEGSYFKTWYFTPRDSVKAFGKDYQLVNIKGLASLSPPPYLDKFPDKFPGLYRTLTSLDEKLATVWPFSNWADHFIITMRYQPKK